MRVRTYCFPGVLRGLPGPRLATTPTIRPRRSLSSPGVMSIAKYSRAVEADQPDVDEPPGSADELARLSPRPKPKNILRRRGTAHALPQSVAMDPRTRLAAGAAEPPSRPAVAGSPARAAPAPAPRLEPPPVRAAPRQPSQSGAELGPILAAIVAFLAKFKAILLLLPKLKLLHHRGHDAGLGRRLRFVLRAGRSRSASSCCCSSTRWGT